MAERGREGGRESGGEREGREGGREGGREICTYTMYVTILAYTKVLCMLFQMNTSVLKLIMLDF